MYTKTNNNRLTFTRLTAQIIYSTFAFILLTRKHPFNHWKKEKHYDVSKPKNIVLLYYYLYYT